MSSDLLDQPVTLADAAREAREASQRLNTHARGYDRIRAGTNPPAIARARAEWGLSVYEWAQAAIAYAEAEDHSRLSWRTALAPGAVPNLPQPAQPETGERASPRDETTLAQAKDDLAAAHAHSDTCWRAYDGIRRSISAAEAIGHARTQWADALAAWVLALVAHAEKEDQHHIEGRQRRKERAMQLQPGDAFGRSLTAAEEVAHQARERIRYRNIGRDRRRYDRSGKPDGH
jgi:hypothetical protein